MKKELNELATKAEKIYWQLKTTTKEERLAKHAIKVAKAWASAAEKYYSGELKVSDRAYHAAMEELNLV